MITIKEEFLTDPKTIRAIELGGYAAVVMWLAMKAYCASKLTDGFVPNEMLGRLPGAPRNWKKAIQALVDCGIMNPDGTRGHGLVDVVEHGKQLHDYLDHAASREQEEKRRKREREKKRKQRAGGDAAPMSHGLSPGDNVGDTEGDDPRDRQGDSLGTSPARVPQPSPAQPTQTNPPGDPSLTGQGDEPPPKPSGLVTCPEDLELTEAQLANLEMGRGIKREEARQIAGQLVAKWVVDPTQTRTRERWLQYLSSAVCRAFDNPDERPKPQTRPAFRPEIV